MRPPTAFEKCAIALVFAAVVVLLYERGVRSHPERDVIPDASGVIRRAEEIARDAVGKGRD